jgi:hypothetical protein
VFQFLKSEMMTAARVTSLLSAERPNTLYPRKTLRINMSLTTICPITTSVVIITGAKIDMTGTIE